MGRETDEAGGLSPVNEENEAGRGFRPEKPYLPLSIKGKRRAACPGGPPFLLDSNGCGKMRFADVA